jgi:hypothetical protein
VSVRRAAPYAARIARAVRTRLAHERAPYAKSAVPVAGSAHVTGNAAATPAGVHRQDVWPGFMDKASDGVRTQTFAHVLTTHAPDAKTLVDLGAGPCLFSRRAQQAGYQVTAVDARSERLPDDLGDIRFVNADVRDFDPSGYDVIAILGLLYHLTLCDQETLLRRCATGAVVIVETQVHTPGFVPPAAEPWGWHVRQERGYEGIVYQEDSNPMASIGNATSFWHTQESLLRLFATCGLPRVTVVNPAHYSKYGTRKFYVARPD